MVSGERVWSVEITLAFYPPASAVVVDAVAGGWLDCQLSCYVCIIQTKTSNLKTCTCECCSLIRAPSTLYLYMNVCVTCVHIYTTPDIIHI